MIIEAAWLGSRSFGQFRHATNLRRGLLSDRLKHLVTLDVMHKVLYSKSPSRFEVRLTHSVCGKEFDPVPKCATCGDDYCAHEVSSTEGPGVGMMSANHVRRRQRRDAVTERPAGSAIMVESAQILGDRWAALVLRAMFSGFNTFEAICDDAVTRIGAPQTEDRPTLPGLWLNKEICGLVSDPFDGNAMGGYLLCGT